MILITEINLMLKNPDTLQFTTHIYLPFPCTGKSQHTYNQQKTETDFREEDVLSDGGVLCRYDELIECFWA